MSSPAKSGEDSPHRLGDTSAAQEDLAFANRIRHDGDAVPPPTHTDDEIDVRHSVLDSVGESEEESDDFEMGGDGGGASGSGGGMLRVKPSDFTRRVKRNDSMAQHRSKVAAQRDAEKDLTFGRNDEPEHHGAHLDSHHTLLDPVTEVATPEDDAVGGPAARSAGFASGSANDFARRTKRNDSLAPIRQKVADKVGDMTHTSLLDGVAEMSMKEDEEYEEEEGDRAPAPLGAGAPNFERRSQRKDSMAPRRAQVAAMNAELKTPSSTLLEGGGALLEEGEEEGDDDDEGRDAAPAALGMKAMPDNFSRRSKRNDSLAPRRAQVAAKVAELAPKTFLGGANDMAECAEEEEEEEEAEGPGCDVATGPLGAPKGFERRSNRADSMAPRRAQVAAKKAELASPSTLLGTGALVEEEEEEEDNDDIGTVGASGAKAGVLGIPSDFSRRSNRSDSMAPRRAQVAAKLADVNSTKTFLGGASDMAEGDEEDEDGDSAPARLGGAGVKTLGASFERRSQRKDSMAPRRAQVAAKKAELASPSTLLGNAGVLEEGDEEEG